MTPAVFVVFTATSEPQDSVAVQCFGDVAVFYVILVEQRVPAAASAFTFAIPLRFEQLAGFLDLFWSRHKKSPNQLATDNAGERHRVKRGRCPPRV